MYFATVAVLLFILPGICIAAQSMHGNLTLLLAGKWLCFWAVGVRLLIAGIRQIVQPRFTASEIFGLTDYSAFPIVRELGFANVCMGLVGVCVLARLDWLVPASLAGGLYYGFAGVGHIFDSHRNAKENVAMFSDLWVFVLLAIFLARSVWR